jgi:hypothetical protein
MTRIDLHPEDLLERAARGTATDADWTRLEQHLAECAACRVERALSAQALLDTRPLRDEKLLVARLKRAVAARLASPTARRPRRKGALVAVALAIGALASVAAAATLVVVRRAPAPPASVAPALPSPRPAKAEEPSGVATVEAEAAQPSTEPVAESAAQTAESAAQTVRRAPAPAAPPVSASELFSRANRARRDGKMTEAVRLYRALQEQFSGTSEELVSRVTLGRLLLDRLGDSRGALLQFNSYLASPGGGGLREEAMVGRALSLGRMGRTAEERVAWKALLDSWPKSTHRKRAEARLTELGGTDVAGAVRAGAGTGHGSSGRAQ